MNDKIGRTLVFGATGQIGAAVVETFARAGSEVVAVSRSGCKPIDGAIRHIAYDPFGSYADEALGFIDELPFNAIVWAQGANRSDSILDFDADAHLDVFKANSVYVAQSLAQLLRAEKLSRPARLCVVSSIWQLAARQNKLSYTVSKAALQGLVLSAAVDLAARDILVNAVLPGVLDTPMTRAMMAPEQINSVSGSTMFGRLTNLKDVAELALFSMLASQY